MQWNYICVLIYAIYVINVFKYLSIYVITVGGGLKTYLASKQVLAKLPFQIRYVTYLFGSVVLICLVLYFKNICLSKIYILYCLVLKLMAFFVNLFYFDLV